jgi:hypothetical protein
MMINNKRNLLILLIVAVVSVSIMCFIQFKFNRNLNGKATQRQNMIIDTFTQKLELYSSQCQKEVKSLLATLQQLVMDKLILSKELVQKHQELNDLTKLKLELTSSVQELKNQKENLARTNDHLESEIQQRKEQEERTQSKQMKKYLINFADGCCKESSRKNCETGISVAKFDACRTFNLEDLDSNFKRRNKDILAEKRGNGNWLWKPYILYKTLISDHVKFGDIVMYSDSGAYFTENPSPYFDLLVNKSITGVTPDIKKNEDYKHAVDKMKFQDVILFSHPEFHFRELKWTKRDAFTLIVGDKSPKRIESIADDIQLTASFLIVKKSVNSMEFISQWLTYCQDKRALTEMENTLGKENYDTYEEHRHDQVCCYNLFR